MHAAPNSFMGSELNPNMTPENITHLKAIYGLDKPLVQQYGDWITNLVRLDFGISFVSGEVVSSVILDRLPVTLWMNLVALVVTFVMSLWLGIKAALNHNQKMDHALSQVSLVSFAMPSYYLALVLMMMLSVGLGWFPIAGMHSLEPPEGLGYYVDMAWHLTLPVSVMVLTGIGSLTLYVRALVIEILKSDYVRFAKSRGLSESIIVR